MNRQHYFKKDAEAISVNDSNQWTDVFFLLRMQLLNSFRY